MILKNAQVENFRCIKDTDPFSVDESVTCLVGKNESGKTAVLQALNKLNPVIAEQKDFDDLDYPVKDWTDYSARKDTDPADCLTTRWVLEDDDANALRPLFGNSVDYKVEFAINKGYSNSRTWSLAVNEAKLIAHLADKHALLQDEKKAFHGASTLDELRKALAEVEGPTERQQKLRDFVTKEFKNEDAGARLRTDLAARLPKFVYFADYLRLPGRVSIEDLKVRVAGNDPNRKIRDSDRAFLAYLSLIGATVADLEKENEFERLTRRLEAASNNLTDKMKKYWSQNRHLRVQVRFEAGLPGDDPPFNSGKVMHTRIENMRHGASTSFDERRGVSEQRCKRRRGGGIL